MGLGDAYAQLSAVDRAAPLGFADLERLAVAAYLVGRNDQGADAWWPRIRRICTCDAARAASCAFWLAFGLLNRGEVARGGGWMPVLLDIEVEYEWI